jgi:glycosyltransferase involved in cell wall biosynthesis
VLISVIIATANRPQILQQALDSLQAQSHRAWEALVVDDGDGRGAEAARARADARIHAWINPGRGQVDARNTAVAHARGDAIAWLDDDDWLEDPAHLALVADHLAQGPALLHRGGWMVRMDADGHEVGREPFDLAASAASLRLNNTLLNPSVAYPKALHRQLGLLDRALDGYYDWDWYLRVLEAGVPLRRIPGLGVAYRVHAGNRSKDAGPVRQARFDALVAKHALQGVVMKHHESVWLERQS